MTAAIILASASPRRVELLKQIHLVCDAHPVFIDETPRENEQPELYVTRMAEEKSAACRAQFGAGRPILAADTCVVIGQRILGKPVNYTDAYEMLSLLSGQTHQVMTAVSLRGRLHSRALSVTQVTFRAINEAEIDAYWRTGEPLDKAGSYAIQGQGAIFVASLQGSFSGVVGLPLFETAQLLAKEGINTQYE